MGNETEKTQPNAGGNGGLLLVRASTLTVRHDGKNITIKRGEEIPKGVPKDLCTKSGLFGSPQDLAQADRKRRHAEKKQG